LRNYLKPQGNKKGAKGSVWLERSLKERTDLAGDIRQEGLAIVAVPTQPQTKHVGMRPLHHSWRTAEKGGEKVGSQKPLQGRDQGRGGMAMRALIVFWNPTGGAWYIRDKNQGGVKQKGAEEKNRENLGRAQIFWKSGPSGGRGGLLFFNQEGGQPKIYFK